MNYPPALVALLLVALSVVGVQAQSSTGTNGQCFSILLILSAHVLPVFAVQLIRVPVSTVTRVTRRSTLSFTKRTLRLTGHSYR